MIFRRGNIGGPSPSGDSIVASKYAHTLPDGRVQCDLCPRFCRLREGQRGMCFVRACRDGRIVLATYGRCSGLAVDPIEKKPLNHFLPGTNVLSFGTAGCNLACKFCQNWHMSHSRHMRTTSEVAPPEYIAEAAVNTGCHSVAFTYDDPVIFMEYAIDTARQSHERGIRTVAVTAGYICPEPRAQFFAHLDAANIDLKAFTDEFYRRNCAARLAPVLDTLRYVYHETETWLEVTTLLISGENDSADEIDAMTRWVVRELGPDVPMHFTAFHPAGRMLDTPSTPLKTLRRARAIALRNGVHHAYTGNVRDPEGANTYCHTCGHLLIQRTGYTINQYALTPDARCPACGTPCPGVFTASRVTGGSESAREPE